MLQQSAYVQGEDTPHRARLAETHSSTGSDKACIGNAPAG